MKNYYILFMNFENMDDKFVVGKNENNQFIFINWKKVTDRSEILVLHSYETANELAQYICDNMYESFKKNNMIIESVDVYEINGDEEDKTIKHTRNS